MKLTHSIFDGIRAVIFDMDGTLIDSMWVWRDVDDEFLKDRGFSNDKQHEFGIEGMSFEETAVYFKEFYHLPESVEEIMDHWNQMAYDRYANDVPYKKGAKELLKACREAGLKTAIATSNIRTLAEATGRRLGFDRYIDVMVTAAEVKKGKPSPDIYLKAAEKLSVSPGECLVFEDLCQGIRAGRAAGMRVCAVADVYSEEQEDTKRELSDCFVQDYLELL